MNKKDTLIAVSGSIAAFRTCELVRNLTKEGYPVSVIMTEHATKFIGPITFEALTGKKVRVDEYEQGMAHIDARNSAAVFAVVPATANIIAKMANGIADDLVTSTYLAANCPVLIAPAMNPNMFLHPSTQRNLKLLQADGVKILDPQEGVVVCGDEGYGKLADIALIQAKILEAYLKFV